MRNRRINKTLAVIGIVALGSALSGIARADTQYQETQITRSDAGGLDTIQAKSSTTETSSAPQVVTVEKPVVLKDKEKIVERQMISQRACRRPLRAARRRVVSYRPRPAAPRTARLESSASRSSYMKTVEHTVEKPVMIEKPVFVDRPVEKIVEKPVYIDRVVEKPVMVEKQVQIEPPQVIEKRVTIEQKEGHHLLNFKLF